MTPVTQYQCDLCGALDTTAFGAESCEHSHIDGNFGTEGHSGCWGFKQFQHFPNTLIMESANNPHAIGVYRLSTEIISQTRHGLELEQMAAKNPSISSAINPSISSAIKSHILNNPAIDADNETAMFDDDILF